MCIYVSALNVFTYVLTFLFHLHTVVLDKQPLFIWDSLKYVLSLLNSLECVCVWGGGTLTILFHTLYTCLISYLLYQD